jgi:hypothetical protein
MKFMKLICVVLAIICLVADVSLGQIAGVSPKKVAREKIGFQLPSSFYSDKSFSHDLKHLPDKKNTPNKIASDLNNPEGTVVLEGQADISIAKEMLENPEQIVLKANSIEVPFKKGQVVYWTNVENVSKHHSLSDPVVLKDLNDFIEKCSVEMNEVPARVTIEHDDYISCCQFMGYSSSSDLFSEPFYEARLNIGCVFNNKWPGRIYYYVCK